MTCHMTPIRRFLRAEDAAISVESAIMMPILMIFCLSAYTYFDAYRKGLVLEKATYAVSDMLSRQETEVVDLAYLNGLQDIFEFITGTENASFIRVTQLVHNNGEIQVEKSLATNGEPGLTQTTLQAHLDSIPTTRPGRSVVAVEVAATYAPAFNIGLPVRRAHKMVVSPPRGKGFDLKLPSPDPVDEVTDVAQTNSGGCSGNNGVGQNCPTN